MLFYEFLAGGKTYKLRLNTRDIVSLEKSLGMNPLGIFGKGDRIPAITEMVTILHKSLAQYQHSMELDDAYNIFDDFIADGNTTTDFIKDIVEIYKVSGIIKKDKKAEENNEKNA